MKPAKNTPARSGTGFRNCTSRRSLRAPCNAPAEPALWLASVKWRTSIPTWWSGTTGALRGNDPRKFKTNGWELFRDGCPEGETPQQVALRADRFIARAMEFEGDVLAFSSGHIIRMIAARWLGLPPQAGRCFFCRPASVGVLAFEHDTKAEPIVALWNHIERPK
jgi:broad specificity phosphatase PhoE